MSVLGVIAAAWFLLAFALGGSQAHTNAWFTPQQLMYAGLVCLALYLAGVGNRKP